MKKRILLLAVLVGWQTAASAADLLQVYQQALVSDQLYQQAISTRLTNREGVPINIANLLPNVVVTANPSVTRQANSGAVMGSTGSPALTPRNNLQKAYLLSLTATQTIFNYAQIANVAAALEVAKGADATLNAALQDLMVRTAKAYFQVLQDEDNLSYANASKIAYQEQLDQVKQQYDVGFKTITDVYTAQASYDTAVANYITAETNLSNDRENLRVITGKFYPAISSLSDDFPLISPKPINVDDWVKVALQQNWTIKQFQYALETARQNVHAQFAGHMPTVNVQGSLSRQFTSNFNSYGDVLSLQRNGPSSQNDKAVQLNITMPIFSGGQVTAQTNQAAYQFQTAQAQLEKAQRDSINLTRQSYLGVLSGISKISADKQAIKSNISSLDGMTASYKVGTETLVDVLNQQQKLFQAQTQYATDRYAFVNNVLALKQAAGTLSFDDLRAINAWLIETRHQGAIGGTHHVNLATYHTKSTTRKVHHQKAKKVALAKSKHRLHS
jgi:outer membrane protein